ncbi:MAG TPA: hypothetical protein VKA54_04365 [Gemmatimonadaceae bacterium]|nr:hypothetical protein [Gemmatimonadaceae bacterium]
MSVLLDELMPVYDVVERHRTLVRATPDAVYAALRQADLAGGPLATALVTLRVLPATLITLVRSPRRALAELRERRQLRAARRGGFRLADFERRGFRIVAERAPEELVIGLLGRFWTPRGDLRATVSVEDFRTGPPKGLALAGWNFTVAPCAGGNTELATETRVWCAEDARASFRAYWLVVRPGSGLIRREMLAAIRREAERRVTRTQRDPITG